MCVLLASLGLIATGPVGDDFFEVIPRALREAYSELFARPSLLHFCHEILRAISATIAYVFHCLADCVIDPQRLADFDEQRRIIRQFIDKMVNLLLNGHIGT